VTKVRVVVAGMGDTGVLVANGLGRAFDVVGISTKPALVSGQELGNRLADPDRWRRNNLTPLERFRRLDRVRVVHGSIDRVDPDAKVVTVDTADGRRIEERYDLLVVATGTTNGFWRHDRVEDLAEVEAQIADVASQVERAASIAIVGGGPTGVSSAANLARRHPAKTVDLYVAHDEPLPGYHPRVRRALTRELVARGVRLHPGHRAVVPDGDADCLTPGPVRWTTGQPPADADLVLWAIGRTRPNSAFLPTDMLDDGGFVRVDEHLQVVGHPSVFAVGDVAATDPNRSSARNWGHRIVTANVKAAAAGRTDKRKPFTAPEHRWGSILGFEDDGMTIYQPNGRSVRIPAWAVQPVLIDLVTRKVIYGGVRRPTPTL
jgi:NADH dehydrogenase FAD-containing subunit